MKVKVRYIVGMFLLASSLHGVAGALEYVVTDTNGTILGGANQLNLGDNPVAKVVNIYLKYTSAEATLINGGATQVSTNGFYGGSYQLSFANSARATVAANSDMTTSFSWTQVAKGVPTAASPTLAYVTFEQGQSTPRLGVDPSSTTVLLGQVTISPGSAVKPTGTTVTVGASSSGQWISTSGGAFDNPIFWDGTDQPVPISVTFTVVPETSSVVMGLLGTVSIVGTAFRRHQKHKSAQKPL